jgi:hypothetical protein
MANFTVRVELHQAEWSDYDQLHAAMEQKGFSRLIAADSGSTYHLPWAEYNGVASLTSMQVLEMARAAAGSTGKRNAVLVTEASSRAWAGLEALLST